MTTETDDGLSKSICSTRSLSIIGFEEKRLDSQRQQILPQADLRRRHHPAVVARENDVMQFKVENLLYF